MRVILANVALACIAVLRFIFRALHSLARFMVLAMIVGAVAGRDDCRHD